MKVTLLRKGKLRWWAKAKHLVLRWALHSVTVHVLVLCCGGSKPRTVVQFASGFAAGQKIPARVYMEKIFRFLCLWYFWKWNFFSCSAEIKLPDFSCTVSNLYHYFIFLELNSSTTISGNIIRVPCKTGLHSWSLGE